jgi:hypothetical protein
MTIDAKSDEILWYVLWIGVVANIIPLSVIFAGFFTSNNCKVYDLAPIVGNGSICVNPTVGTVSPQWFILIACLATVFINIIYYFFLYFRYVRTFTALYSMFYPLQRTSMTSYLLFVTMALKAGVVYWLILLLAGLFCFVGYECISYVDFYKHTYVCRDLRQYLLRDGKTSKGREYLVIKQREFLGYETSLRKIQKKLKIIAELYETNKSSIGTISYTPRLLFRIKGEDDENYKLIQNNYNIVEKEKETTKVKPFFTTTEQGAMKGLTDDMNKKVSEITSLTKKLLKIHLEAMKTVDKVIDQKRIIPRINEWSLKSSLTNVGLYVIGSFLIFFPFSYLISDVYAGSHVSIIAITYIYICFELLWLTVGVYFTGVQKFMEKALIVTQVVGYFIIGIVLITDVNCGGCT